MFCTYETMEQFCDSYCSIRRIADRNGRFETEAAAKKAAKAAGLDINRVAVVFIVD